MSRLDHDLRSDDLGTLLGASFDDLRAAEPSPASWSRIARDMEPVRQGPWRRLAGRLAMLAMPDARPLIQLLTWAALPTTGALAVIILAGTAIESARGSGGVLASAAPGPLGMSVIEWEYQPRFEDHWIGVARKGSLAKTKWRLSQAPTGLGGGLPRAPLVPPPGIVSQ